MDFENFDSMFSIILSPVQLTLIWLLFWHQLENFNLSAVMSELNLQSLSWITHVWNDEMCVSQPVVLLYIYNIHMGMTIYNIHMGMISSVYLFLYKFLLHVGVPYYVSAKIKVVSSLWFHCITAMSLTTGAGGGL